MRRVCMKTFYDEDTDDVMMMLNITIMMISGYLHCASE